MNLEAPDRATTKVPEELFGQLPRRVRRAGNDVIVASVILLGFFLLGATFFGWYIFDYVQQTRDRAALRANGRLTAGEVTDLALGRGGKETLHYAFTAQGKSYSGKARLSSSDGIILAKTDPLLIRYLPSDPTISHPDAWEWSALLDVDWAVVGFPLMVLTTVAFFILRRERRLALEGKPAEGAVTSCTRDGERYRVVYEFLTESGERIRGASSCINSYEDGQKIWILYESERPRRNHAYPLFGYDIVGRVDKETL